RIAADPEGFPELELGDWVFDPASPGGWDQRMSSIIGRAGASSSRRRWSGTGDDHECANPEANGVDPGLGDRPVRPRGRGFARARAPAGPERLAAAGARPGDRLPDRQGLPPGRAECPGV